MARRIRDATLETRTARSKLRVSGKPYFKGIGSGLHVGYRKGKTVGRWVVRIYSGNQSYLTETLADADDSMDANGFTVLDFWQAQDKARERLAQLRDGQPRSIRRLSVNDALESYLHWMDGNRKSSADARSRANLWIVPDLGDIQVCDLKADQIRRWHRSMAEAPRRSRSGGDGHEDLSMESYGIDAVRRRRATANRVLTILKAALNHAFREGNVPSDAEWRRVKPFENVETARVRYLAVEEAQRLIRAANGEFKNLVQAALQTGARYGELVAMRAEDFNADVGTVTVRISKGGKPRHIVLTEEGQALFSRISEGKGGDELIFTLDNGLPWKKSSQSRPMLSACRDAGIDPPIGFHGLRHTWASLAAMNGVPLLVIAKNLGHTDTRMVEKHYGHLSPSFIADAIRKGAPTFGFT